MIADRPRQFGDRKAEDEPILPLTHCYQPTDTTDQFSGVGRFSRRSTLAGERRIAHGASRWESWRKNSPVGRKKHHRTPYAPCGANFHRTPNPGLERPGHRLSPRSGAEFERCPNPSEVAN